MFFKIGVFKHFANLTENTCVGVERLRVYDFSKKKLQHGYFPVKFANFLRTVLEYIWERLLLSIVLIFRFSFELLIDLLFELIFSF